MDSSNQSKQEWEFPKTSVMKCGGCGHRLCTSCRRLKQTRKQARPHYNPIRGVKHFGSGLIVDCCAGPNWTFRQKFDQEELDTTYVRCSNCKEVSPLSGWLISPHNHIEPHELNRRTISANQYETERLALGSQVARGITTQEEADDWLGRWRQLPNGRYRHEEELFKKLADEDDEGGKLSHV